MKLAVDTHHLLLENAGTRRVTVRLVEQFRQMDNIELTELQPSYSLSKEGGLFRKLKGHFLRFFWVHIHLPVLCSFRGIDVLFSPEFNTPLYVRCKRAVIAHDAHIRAQREYTSKLWFYFYYIPFIEFAIRKADIVFTISEYAKEQIIELMHVDKRKIRVAYNGVDDLFTGHVDAELTKLNELGLEYGGYILFVGTFETRKNIERLLEAFFVFKQKRRGDAEGIKLAIVGKPSAGKHSDRSRQIHSLITKLNLNEDVILCGYVPDENLPSIYKGARMVVFPSLYEGFGLPILEGFASGVPVLTSDVCSMPEISGGAALLTDPYNVNDISEKLEILMSDLVLREKLITEGKQRVKLFNWKQTARQMITDITCYYNKDGSQ